jgi:hypothetical protein
LGAAANGINPVLVKTGKSSFLMGEALMLTGVAAAGIAGADLTGDFAVVGLAPVAAV